MIKDMLDRGADDDLIKSITKASQEEIDSVKNNQAEGKAEGGLKILEAWRWILEVVDLCH